MRTLVIGIIQEILTENEEKRNGRDYAMLAEIKSKLSARLSSMLNEMYSNGEIAAGETLNDKYVKLT